MLGRIAAWCTPERLAGYSGIVLFGYLVLLVLCYRQGIWFVGLDGAREGIKHGFLPGERLSLAAAMLIPAAFILLGSVTALAAGGLLIGLGVRRVQREASNAF